MKKIIILLLVIFFLVTSCSNLREENQKEHIESKKDIVELNVYKTIQYEEDSFERELGFEKIVVLTDAKKESDGTFSWDDSHKFAIKAFLSEGEIDIMPLQNFQFASFEIASFIKVEEEKFCLIVNIATGAKYEIREYSFEQERKAFTEKMIYDATNINYLKTSK